MAQKIRKSATGGLAAISFGETIPDKVIDAAQRRWWLVSGVSLPAISAWAKSELGVGTLSWADALVVGVFGALLFTFLLLGAIAFGRQLYPKNVPVRDRKEFVDERITLAELTAGGAPLVTHKVFKRCMIEGPGQIKFQAKVEHLWCSTKIGNLIEKPEGADIHGCVIAVNCVFIECYFDVAIIGTSADMPALRSSTEFETALDWQNRYFA